MYYSLNDHTSSTYFLTTQISYEMSTICSGSYFIEEDTHLYHVYHDISQNPVIGINQSRDQFWKRIQVEYEKYFHSQPRPRRSLQARMISILAAVSKLREYINQNQNKNPSGASRAGHYK